METSASDIILLPLLLTLFGALVYGLSANAGLKKGKLPASRWVGVVLIVLAMAAGRSYTFGMFDEFTRIATTALGKRMVLASYAAFGIPFLAFLVVLVLDLVYRKRLSHSVPTPAA
jgi:hypothetical protein